MLAEIILLVVWGSFAASFLGPVAGWAVSYLAALQKPAKKRRLIWLTGMGFRLFFLVLSNPLFLLAGVALLQVGPWLAAVCWVVANLLWFF